MEIKFFESPTCPDCPAAKKNLKEVAEKMNISDKINFFDISTTDGRIEALNNMVMSSPALVIGDEAIPKEVLLNAEKLEDEMNNRIN